jgi:Tfp pilus assembly PilM family ATPase
MTKEKLDCLTDALKAAGFEIVSMDEKIFEYDRRYRSETGQIGLVTGRIALDIVPAGIVDNTVNPRFLGDTDLDCG